MARIRSIKPAFFMDEDIAELPAMTRLLYIGLWTLADGHGKMLDRPKRIKAEIFPYDTIYADEHLQLLHDAGFIIRYVVAGVGYILIPKFRKHQRISGSEASETSEFPDPPNQNTEEAVRKQSGSSQEAANVLEGKGRERKGESRARSDFADASDVSPEEMGDYTAEPEPIEFRDFMEVFPIKSGREAARREFVRRYPSLDKKAQAVRAIRQQVAAGVEIRKEAVWWIRDGRENDPIPAAAVGFVPRKIT